MRTVNRDHFLQEHMEAEEWDVNPIKKTMQTLFGSSLSEANYKKLTVDQIGAVLDESFRKDHIYENPSYRQQAKRLVKKVRACTDVSKAVLILGDYLLS